MKNWLHHTWMALASAAGTAVAFVYQTSDPGMAAVAGTGAGILLGRLGNVLHDSMKLQDKPSLFLNHDLLKLTGQAVKKIVSDVATDQTGTYCKEDLEQLNVLAAGSPGLFQELASVDGFDQIVGTLQTDELYRWLMHGMEGPTTPTAALEKHIWLNLLKPMAARLRCQFLSGDEVILGTVAERLHREMPITVRELLKADFSNSGEAYAALELNILGKLMAGMEKVETKLTAFAQQSQTQHDELKQMMQGMDHLARQLMAFKPDAAETLAFKQWRDRQDNHWDKLLNKLDGISDGIVDIKKQNLQTQMMVAKLGDALTASPSLPLARTPTTTSPITLATDTWVGRTKQSNALKRQLITQRVDGQTAVVYVSGMFGVGKTFLVDHFLETAWGKEPGASRPERLALRDDQPLKGWEELRDELADRLKLQAAPEERLAAIQACFTSKTSLLIIENIDDGPTLRKVSQLVHQLPGCGILLTGREQLADDASGWEAVEVKPFDGEDSLKQLKKELGKSKYETFEVTQLLHLAVTLGGLPLALHLAAGQLASCLSPQAFLAELVATGYTLRPSDADPRLTVDEVRSILHSSFALSWRRFGECHDCAWQRALAALAEGPLAGVSPRMGQVLTQLEATPYVRFIRDARLMSLLTVAEEGNIRLHPLWAQWLRDQQGDPAHFQRMTAWFLKRLPEPEDQTQENRGWQEIHQEYETLRDWLGRVPDVNLSRVERAGSRFAISVGPFLAWAQLCERGLLKTSDPETQSNYHWTWAYVAMRSGNMEQTERSARAMLQLIRVNHHDHYHALAWGLLADLATSRGELDEALRIRREEELPVYERLGDVRSKAVTMGKIADILQARGELDEALRIRHEEQLPVYERLGEVRSKAVTMGKIADILHARGQLDEALRIYRQDVLPIAERLGDVRGNALTMSKIADILEARGQLDEALRIHREEQLPVYERLGDIRSKAVTMGKIADILKDRGELAEALRIYRQDVLPITERLGDVHSLIRCKWWIAIMLNRRGKQEDQVEAKALLRWAYQAAKERGYADAKEIAGFMRQWGVNPDSDMSE